VHAGRGEDNRAATLVRTETLMSSPTIEQLQNFDKLPNDAIVPPKITAAVLGISTRQLRRNPPIPKIKTGIRSCGYRAGSIRALARGESPQAA
jgi:hypothetical protein